MKWSGQNTQSPESLRAHYEGNKTWERARFWYENWRLTTALVDPPPPWEEINPRMKLALCAAFQGGTYEHERNET